MSGLRDDGLSEQAEEGYFASVSDLMVGVLFVFLLMLTIFALNFHDGTEQLEELIKREKAAEQTAYEAKQSAQEEAKRAQLSEERARHLKAEAERLRARNEALQTRLDQAAAALVRELRDREEQRASLLQRVAERLDAGGIKFTLDQQSGVLRLSDAVPFAVGRSDLTDPRARQTTEVLGRVLAEILPCFATGADRQGCAPGDAAILETVLVEGHTDSQPYPNMTPAQSQQENDRLSAARALTVFTELRHAHPVLDTLRNPSEQPLLGISGYGQRRPLPGSNVSTSADAANRRIDLRFVLASRTSDQLRLLLEQIDALRQEKPQ